MGKIRRAAAEEFGPPRSAVITDGGGDAAVGGVGLGPIASGQAFISLGTATQLIVTTDRYISQPDKLVHSFAHALPGRWYAMAAMLNGAGVLAFAGRLLGETPDSLQRAAADGYNGPGGLVFLPYLSGERTPLDDPYARGALFGMSEATTPSDVARAVMEGVALTLPDARDCLHAAGAAIEHVCLIGGGAKSAARLARIAAAGEPAEAVCKAPEIADVTEPEPEPELTAAFAKQRERFRALYAAVRLEFRRKPSAPTAPRQGVRVTRY